MSSRNVMDAGGRNWACNQDGAGTQSQGRDVSILCTTDSVTAPVRLSVGWQWMTMADNGLARMIANASPVPRVKR
ncbi:MAG: hypothetical protein WD801_12050 [Gemmatimonadaceae bacterium]